MVAGERDIWGTRTNSEVIMITKSPASPGFLSDWVVKRLECLQDILQDIVTVFESDGDSDEASLMPVAALSSGSVWRVSCWPGGTRCCGYRPGWLSAIAFSGCSGNFARFQDLL